MDRILIIKLGAMGDVLRTTPLLRVLEGGVTWVTSPHSLPLLAHNPYLSSLRAVNASGDAHFNHEYDLVINLEDGGIAAELATRAAKGRIVGPFMSEKGIRYAEVASEWFDMSLISRFGKQQADALKMANRKTYQEFLFEMVGRRFAGEEPILNTPLTKPPVPNLVGIEARAGGVWPLKRWNKYEALAARLEALGLAVKFFCQRDSIEEYINDINECGSVICGDTLAMHLALALRKRVVAIFICTSPYEIHDYGRLIKIVSPLWQEYFYRRDFGSAAADAIAVDTVFEAFKGQHLVPTGIGAGSPFPLQSYR
jgi:heptosyltransferase-2